MCVLAQSATAREGVIFVTSSRFSTSAGQWQPCFSHISMVLTSTLVRVETSSHSFKKITLPIGKSIGCYQKEGETRQVSKQKQLSPGVCYLRFRRGPSHPIPIQRTQSRFKNDPHKTSICKPIRPFRFLVNSHLYLLF